MIETDVETVKNNIDIDDFRDFLYNPKKYF